MQWIECSNLIATQQADFHNKTEAHRPLSHPWLKSIPLLVPWEVHRGWGSWVHSLDSKSGSDDTTGAPSPSHPKTCQKRTRGDLGLWITKSWGRLVCASRYSSTSDRLIVPQSLILATSVSFGMSTLANNPLPFRGEGSTTVILTSSLSSGMCF